MGEGGTPIVSGVAVVSLIVVLLTTVLVVFSFHGLEYYEMGFVRRKSTSVVDTSVVYQAGFHYIGLDAEFKVFQADAHIVNLESISVFTQNRLEVLITCTFQYFLRPEGLRRLHDTYDLQYEETLRNSAVDALKGATAVFDTREFGSARADVERALFRAVRKRLGGTCCRPDCDNLPQGCEPGCKAPAECTDEDLGLNAEARYFQLGYVDIPDSVLSLNLQTLVQLENGVREQYRQREQLVRKTTEESVTKIEDSAEEISQNATAQAALVASRARARARSRVEDSHNAGLALIYQRLNVTEDGPKASLNYLRSLRDHGSVFMTINYGSLVTGPVNGRA